MPQIFKTKWISENIEVEKKFRIGGVKMSKSKKKIEKKITFLSNHAKTTVARRITTI